jgi:asparagine synthetase B (glutamine-hydrolysing)
MRHSLEVRVPMLDEELIDFGLNLPHEFRVRSRVGKRILRRLAEEKLPPAWPAVLGRDSKYRSTARSIRCSRRISEKSCSIARARSPTISIGANTTRGPTLSATVTARRRCHEKASISA